MKALQDFFGYFRNMHDTAGTLRFHDSIEQVHHISGTQGGQQGDPLEMLRFCHTILPLWGGIMARFSSARAAAYADDGFINANLLMALQILSALKHAFKEDLDMELTLHKCQVLIPALSQEDANAIHKEGWLLLRQGGVRLLARIPSPPPSPDDDDYPDLFSGDDDAGDAGDAGDAVFVSSVADALGVL